MLTLAFSLICAAAGVGAILAIRYARASAAEAPRLPLRAAHAGLGAAGLIALLLALHRGLGQTSMGTAGFGVIAGILLGLALLVGLLLAQASWRGRRPAAVLVGTHAGLAIAGLVVLLALLVLR